ncbi:DUF6082 family protein [Streptomyces sp. NPDC058861]|uniref:DUF6082 family protein n=1 Tax=Streptomyces sp. NPDC058861 TaxID=3346653 RepID=UPI00368B5D38
MRTGTAVLLAGATVSAAVAAVGVTRLRQEARHQRERNEVALAQNQMAWLTQVSTDPAVAEKWRPAGVGVEEYMGLMSANLMLCTLSLRVRLGFVSEDQLDLYASMVMDSAVARRYWERFGPLRVQEAGTDPLAVRVNAALAQAAARATRADRQGEPAA